MADVQNGDEAERAHEDEARRLGLEDARRILLNGPLTAPPATTRPHRTETKPRERGSIHKIETHR